MQTVQADVPGEVTGMGLVSRLALIAGVMSVVAFLALTVAMSTGWLSVSLLVLAFFVCLFSGLAGHLAGEYPAGDDFFPVRMASSLVVRTVLPLAVCVVAKFTDLVPFEPGFVILVLVFYLAGMAVDVSLQAGRLKRLNDSADK